MNKAIIIILLFLSGIANAEEKKIVIDIDGLNSKLSVSETLSFRWSPHMYFDQAVSTISKVEKNVVFLCRRRFSSLRDVNFSMFCYTSSETKGQVEVGGKVVHTTGEKVKHNIGGEVVYRDKAWIYSIKLSKENFTNELLILTEAIATLPYKKPLKRTQ